MSVHFSPTETHIPTSLFPSGQNLKDIARRSLLSVVQYHRELGAKNHWLFLALAVGILVRSYFLPQAIRGDEAFTFLYYVNADLRSLFDYSSTNNHVLNTLLIKLSAFIFGASPASIRFPAFLTGILAIAITFYAARAVGKNRNSGILAGMALAVFPYLVLYSTNARGYTLVVLFTLLLVMIGERFVNNPSKTGVLLMAFCAALGMLAIPIMVLPIAGISLWIVCLMFLKKFALRAVLLRFVFPFGLLSGIFTLILYAPIIIASNGPAPIIANKFIQSVSWDVFLPQIVPHVQATFAELSRDIHPAVLLAMLALAALGLFDSAKRRNWGMLLILPCLLVGAWLILFIQRTTLYPRMWTYAIPFVLLAADAGLAILLDRLPHPAQTSINAALALGGVFVAINLMSRNVIARYLDSGAFPEAPLAVEYLKPIITPEDSLRVSPTAQWPVYFYLWYDQAPQPRLEQNATDGRLFFVSKKSRGPLDDDAAQRFTLLLDMDNMALYQEKR